MAHKHTYRPPGLHPLLRYNFPLSPHYNYDFISYISPTVPCLLCLTHTHILSFCELIGWQVLPLALASPCIESIASQCSRCVNDVSLFGRHSALCFQIPISIIGCIIILCREAHQVSGLIATALVKVMKESRETFNMWKGRFSWLQSLFAALFLF